MQADPKSQPIRVFIAISIPETAKQELTRIQTVMKKANIRAAWPKPASFHLTLKFLGYVQPGDVSRLQAAMAPLKGAFPGLQLSAGRLGVFPSVKKVRVAWAGIGGQTHRLSQLFGAIEDNLFQIGINKEKRRFSPHFTLARVKQPARPEKWIQLIDQCKQMHTPPFEIEKVHLFQSRLHPAGAVHTKLFSVNLSGYLF